MIQFHIERVAPTNLAETIGLFIEQVYPGDPEETQRHFTGHTEGKADTFLAYVGTDLAGYLTIRWQSNNPLFRENNLPLIHHLAVFEQFQRQGIATKLMETAEQLIASRAKKLGLL